MDRVLRLDFGKGVSRVQLPLRKMARPEQKHFALQTVAMYPNRHLWFGGHSCKDLGVDYNDYNTPTKDEDCACEQQAATVASGYFLEPSFGPRLGIFI
jgi:hypothetical protein